MVSSVLRIWCVVSVLCTASFTMVTSEFTPIGLLSQISSDLVQPPSTIGLTVTLYAWIGAASGLMSNWLNRWIPRKALLILLMLTLAVSNSLAALSSEFSTLLWCPCHRCIGPWCVLGNSGRHSRTYCASTARRISYIDRVRRHHDCHARRRSTD